MHRARKSHTPGETLSPGSACCYGDGGAGVPSAAIWSRIATIKSVFAFTALVSSVFSLRASDKEDSTAWICCS